MICPYCSSDDIRVLETRETKPTETRRRRECQSCERRFTTYERVEITPILVVKKDGKRQQFNRDKIIGGLVKACEKRPVSIDQIQDIADKVEYKIRSSGESEVKSTKIGILTMNRIKKIDKVAYIRFSSVYRDFTDVESFEKEIAKLTKQAIEQRVDHNVTQYLSQQERKKEE